MTIDTRMDGDPGSIRAAGSWLEDSLAGGVYSRTSDAHRARTEAESGWWGDAGESFHTRLTEHARHGDDLANAAKDVGGAFHRYAGELATAQQRMSQARATATAAGLTVTEHAIGSPGPAPAPLTALAADGSATVRDVQEHVEAVRAQQEHARKTVAYLTAAKQAGEARTIEKGAKNFLDGVFHRYLSGGDGSVLNALGDLDILRGWLGGAAKNALTGKAQEYADEAGKVLDDLLHHGGDAEAALAKFGDLLDEATKAGNGAELWEYLSKDIDFGHGLSASAGALTIASMADGFLHHGDFGKTIMSGMTGVGIDVAIAGMGIEGGPAGLVALAAYETYQHPDGAGQVAKLLHDLPGDGEDWLIDKAGDFLGAHGHQHLGAVVDTVADVHRTINHVEGDFLQGAITGGGDAAHHLVDNASDALDTQKDMFLDAVHGDAGGFFHDGIDGAQKQLDDLADTGKDLGGDAVDTAKHVTHDATNGITSAFHHVTGWF